MSGSFLPLAGRFFLLPSSSLGSLLCNPAAANYEFSTPSGPSLRPHASLPGSDNTPVARGGSHALEPPGLLSEPGSLVPGPLTR